MCQQENIDALLDTGAQKSVVSTCFVQRHNLWHKVRSSSVRLKGLADKPIKNHGHINLHIKFPHCPFSTTMDFFVVPSNQPIMIVGVDFCDKNMCDILFSKNIVRGPGLYAPIFFKNGHNQINNIKCKPEFYWYNYVRPCIVRNLKPSNNHCSYTDYAKKRKKKQHSLYENSQKNKNSPRNTQHIFLSQNETILQPKAETIAKFKLSDPLFSKIKGHQVYFEPKQRDKHLPVMAGRALITIKSKSIPISFLNLSNEEIKLKRFTMIGWFTILNDDFKLIPYDQMREGGYKVCSLNIEENSLPEKVANQQELEKELKQMEEREPWLKKVDIGEVSIGQKVEAYQFFVKNRQTFAKNRFELGKTNLIEAKLNIKTEKPIYTRQYPLDAKKKGNFR